MPTLVTIPTRKPKVAVKKPSGRRESDSQWLELYGGPGDGIKRTLPKLPVTLKFPDDFVIENAQLAAIPPVLYKRWERVNTLVEDSMGKPYIIAATVYYPDGTNPPLHRRLTYDKFKRKA